MKVEHSQQSPSRQSQPRRTRWQEYVISRANYLDNERSRLCQQACQDSAVTAYVEAAMTGHLTAARRAAGVEGDGRTPIQLARRDRLANAWTGASVEGAF